MYFSSSQASRLLPIPAGPVIETRRARRSRPVVREQVLQQAELLVATDERRLGQVRRDPGRRAGRRPAAPARPATGACLPLSACSPASSNAMAALAARWVASPTSTVPGWATDWSRAAVLTRSPGDHALVRGADGHGRLAGQDPGARLDRRAEGVTASTRSRPARTARSASSSRAVGAPQTAITASPMNFSTVPP